MSLPEVPGILTADDLLRTGESIAQWQLSTGMVPWFPDGHADPWNHVEAAMAMDLVGLRSEAEAAYQWLVDVQRPDGAWHQYYLADRVEQEKLDANVVAYVATGVWHHYLLTKDEGFIETMWPVVERAIEFVLDLQQPRGEILWARHTDGTPWSFALLTGSSSICHSLRCAIALAEHLDHERPDWELSLGRLAEVIRTRPDDAFAPKHRWAMDWYYPVLSGAIAGPDARDHLDERRDTFVMEGKGVRCVSDRPWVTAAETCECMMAYLLVGEHRLAAELFSWVQNARTDDGRYHTGIVYPQLTTFPAGEQSTYTASAIILGADALSRSSAASGLFVDHEMLPPIIDVTEDVRDPSLD